MSVSESIWRCHQSSDISASHDKTQTAAIYVLYNFPLHCTSAPHLFRAPFGGIGFENGVMLNKLHVISLLPQGREDMQSQRERETGVEWGGHPGEGRQMNCKKHNNNM